MSRPHSTIYTKKTTIYLPPDVWEAMRVECIQRGIHMGEMIVEAMGRRQVALWKNAPGLQPMEAADELDLGPPLPPDMKLHFRASSWAGWDVLFYLLPDAWAARRLAGILIRNAGYCPNFTFDLPSGSRWVIVDAKGRVKRWERAAAPPNTVACKVHRPVERD